MALPHLIKYVYTHGTDEVIRRGKKIHALGFVELVEYDDLFGSAVVLYPEYSRTKEVIIFYQFDKPDSMDLFSSADHFIRSMGVNVFDKVR